MVDGYYVSGIYFSILFLSILVHWAFESERRQAAIWEVLCILPASVGSARDTMLAVLAISHYPDKCRLHMIHDLITFALPPFQSSCFFPPIPPSCVTFTARTTHKGSTPPNIPINRANPPPPPPSPSFILPSQTSTISTSLHPLHHK